MSDKRRRGRSYTYIKSTKGPIIKFKLKVIVIIFFIITAACFAIYMTGANFGEEEEGSFTATWQEHSPTGENTENTDKSNKNDKDKDSDSESQAETGETKENIQIENPVPESNALTPTYFSKCAFVGDSITVGLSDYQLVPMKNVIAEIGMNIEKINTEKMQTAFGETTVLDALTQAKPENIYIMLGSNGIAWMSLEEMIEEYSEFTQGIEKSLPDSKIYVLSIPPVTEKKEQSEESILNADIDRYNSMLLELANKNGYYYVDINSELKGEDGKFSEEDAADDGMHFNKSTYDVMLDYILRHVVQ